jgi:hypothetical protein
MDGGKAGRFPARAGALGRLWPDGAAPGDGVRLDGCKVWCFGVGIGQDGGALRVQRREIGTDGAVERGGHAGGIAEGEHQIAQDREQCGDALGFLGGGQGRAGRGHTAL